MSSNSAVALGSFMGGAIDATAFILIGWAAVRALFAITKHAYRTWPYIATAVLGGLISLIVSSAVNAGNPNPGAGIAAVGRTLVVVVMIVIALVIGVVKSRKRKGAPGAVEKDL